MKRRGERKRQRVMGGFGWRARVSGWVGMEVPERSGGRVRGIGAEGYGDGSIRGKW